MTSVADLLADIGAPIEADSPETRPFSPSTRPAEIGSSIGSSPNSPNSPEVDVPRDLPAEKRARRAIAILDDNPSITRAIITDVDAELNHVVVTIALRGQAIGELLIPKDRYDGPALIEAIARHGAQLSTSPTY